MPASDHWVGQEREKDCGQVGWSVASDQVPGVRNGRDLQVWSKSPQAFHIVLTDRRSFSSHQHQRQAQAPDCFAEIARPTEDFGHEGKVRHTPLWLIKVGADLEWIWIGNDIDEHQARRARLPRVGSESEHGCKPSQRRSDDDGAATNSANQSPKV